MKILFTCSVWICLTFATPELRESEGWKGIVPLHSTRADVERLLGPSEEKCRCFYTTESEKIFVEYSQSRCKGFLTGWNVAADTVLMISVQPNAEVRLSDLSLDLTRFVKTSGTDTPVMHYTDKEAGIRYTVLESGIVTSVDYIPKLADYSRRCKGFPSLPDLGHREFNPFDTYSDILLSDERARLDNFSTWLREQPQMKGYILVYAGKDFPSSRAKRRAQRARDYLIRVGRLDPKKIEIIEGGYREQFQIQLYIVPASLGPPTPHPTLSPSSVPNGVPPRGKNMVRKP